MIKKINAQLQVWARQGKVNSNCTIIHLPSQDDFSTFINQLIGVVDKTYIDGETVLLINQKINNDQFKSIVLDAYASCKGQVPMRWACMALQ
jgi:hypothetical protein